jgi:hypothetical protein
VILKDEIRFYYGADSQGATGANNHQQSSGIGLFTVPRDRFAGIRPVALSAQPTLINELHHIGQVTMRPVDLTGCTKITVNADASDGEIRVELLDSVGYRVRGYTKDDAQALTGDDLRHVVQWNGRGLTDLPGGEYMLRIHLDKASIFAVDVWK